MSDELSEYLRAKEPGKAELAGLWRAAIGLQKVDGLTPSAYLHFEIVCSSQIVLKHIIINQRYCNCLKKGCGIFP